MSVDDGKAARSALWSVVENAGLCVISMGSLIIYTHLLSSSEFGLFSIVLALIELLQVVVTMLFHDALVQRKDATEMHFDTAFTFSMGLSVAMLLSCCLLSPLFAAVVKEPNAAPVLAAMALCLPAAGLSATLVARQRRSLSFRPLAIRSLIGRFAGAIAGIVLVVLGAGVWGLIAQQILIQLIGSLLLWGTSDARPRLRFARKEFGELCGFGLYAVGSLFLMFGTKRVFTVLTGLFLGVTVAGYLNLSFRAVDAFWAIASTAATQVALPMLSNLQSDLPRLKRTFQFSTSIVCTILYLLFVGIALTAPEVVSVLFGSKWLPSAPYVTALALSVVVQAPRLLIGPTLTALGRPRDLLLDKAAELVFIVAAVLITRTPSLSWAIGIWIARELLSFPITSYMLKKSTELGLLDQLRGVAVPLIASTVMAVVVLTIRAHLPHGMPPELRLVLMAATGAACFLAVAFVLDRDLFKKALGVAQQAFGRQLPKSSVGMDGSTPQAGIAK